MKSCEIRHNTLRAEDKIIKLLLFYLVILYLYILFLIGLSVGERGTIINTYGGWGYTPLHTLTSFWPQVSRANLLFFDTVHKAYFFKKNLYPTFVHVCVCVYVCVSARVVQAVESRKPRNLARYPEIEQLSSIEISHFAI